MNILVICGSVTHAIRAKNILEARGIRAYVQKAPAGLYQYGCNYAVRLDYPAPMGPVSLLRACGVRTAAVFCEQEGQYVQWTEAGV